MGVCLINFNIRPDSIRSRVVKTVILSGMVLSVSVFFHFCKARNCIKVCDICEVSPENFIICSILACIFPRPPNQAAAFENMGIRFVSAGSAPASRLEVTTKSLASVILFISSAQIACVTTQGYSSVAVGQ